MKGSLKFLILTIILFFIECIIALFINDNIIRPYIGDILVIPLIFCFLKIFIRKNTYRLAIFVFLVGVVTEVIQLFNVPAMLGINKGSMIGIVIGSTFDMKDIICYFIGMVLIILFSRLVSVREKGDY